MKLGVVTPVVTRLPGAHAAWEETAGIDEIARVAGGRLVLGVGVGSLREEFDLLGAEFGGRGDRGDDAIRALRASLSDLEPEYRGEHYSYDGFVVDPYAVQRRVPIWIGGRTAR